MKESIALFLRVGSMDALPANGLTGAGTTVYSTLVGV